MRGIEPGHFLLIVRIFAAEEHEDAESDNRRRGNVVGHAANDASHAASRGQADQRHAGLERDEDQRHAQPLRGASHSRSAERSGDREGIDAQREDERQQAKHAVITVRSCSLSRRFSGSTEGYVTEQMAPKQ
jgi:hypothetical protein